MTEMMEMLRTLVKEKGQAISPSPQNEIAYHEQRREESTYPAGFSPPYGPAIHVPPPMPQTRAFPYGYAPPPTQVNETG